jgi:hypothetical protein
VVRRTDENGNKEKPVRVFLIIYLPSLDIFHKHVLSTESKGQL